MKDEFVITDIYLFCNAARLEAVRCLSVTKTKTDVMDDYITIEQCIEIVADVCGKKNLESLTDLASKFKIIIDEDNYVDIILGIAEQIYHSALSKLAADDIIECAWDAEEDKMVFWMEDNDGLRHDLQDSII
tara:strand:- start:972 stop:1367 length:396 start_codon:yes stop_codon:yes gene_type:complete